MLHLLSFFANHNHSDIANNIITLYDDPSSKFE